MGSVFKYLGLSVGCITNDLSDTDERKKACLCDITYGTNNEFGFDYRDNLRIQKKIWFSVPQLFIVDEVDSILIDGQERH